MRVWKVGDRAVFVSRLEVVGISSDSSRARKRYGKHGVVTSGEYASGTGRWTRVAFLADDGDKFSPLTRNLDPVDIEEEEL